MSDLINIYTELTPNPNSLKFVTNINLLTDNKAVEYNSYNEAKNNSPIAEELFKFPFVKSVFITANFITIMKSEDIEWDFIQMELREFIKDWLSDNKEVVKNSAQFSENINNINNNYSFPETEWDNEIKKLLDEYVRPAVEGDGGAIDFVGFENGKVHLLLKGSCSGCPSSTATLKFGIENILKQHISEVNEVVAVNA